MSRKKKKKKGLFPPKYFIGALISGITGRKKAKEQEAKAEADRLLQEQKYEEEKANRQKLSMSPEIEKLKEGLGGTEIQRRQEAAERSKAGAMAAATRGGTRTDAFAAMRAGSEAEGLLASQQSQAVRGGLKSAVTERGRLRDMTEDRSKTDLVRQAQKEDYAREDQMAAQANFEASNQQMYGAIDAGIGTLAGMSDKKVKKNIKKVGKTESGVPISDFEYKKDKDAPKGPGRYRGVIAQDLMGTEHEGAVKKINKDTLGVNYSKLDVKLGKIGGGKLKDKITKNKKKMERDMMPEQEMEPNKPEVSPGKFSHESNPIDLVQKNGNGEDEKIGEMTGGEAIVPPKNVKQIRSMIDKKDGKSLVALMNRLLTKWDREADENEESRQEFEKTKGGVTKAKHGAVHKPRMASGKQMFAWDREARFKNGGIFK